MVQSVDRSRLPCTEHGFGPLSWCGAQVDNEAELQQIIGQLTVPQLACLLNLRAAGEVQSESGQGVSYADFAILMKRKGIGC